MNMAKKRFEFELEGEHLSVSSSTIINALEKYFLERPQCGVDFIKVEGDIFTEECVIDYNKRRI